MTERRQPVFITRMADFVDWVTAGESAFGWPAGKFARCYETSIREASGKLTVADPLSDTLKRFTQCAGTWKGTATELCQALNRHVRGQGNRASGWATDPAVLGREIQKVVGTLRAVGVLVETARVGKARTRCLVIENRTGEKLIRLGDGVYVQVPERRVTSGPEDRVDSADS